jgi:hypothetical protein
MVTYEFSAHEQDGYLFVTAVGERTRATISRLVEDVMEFNTQRPYTRILVDIRGLAGFLGPFEIMDVVNEEFPRIQPLRIKKIAIVDRQIPSSGNAFIETVARNRGFNLRVFDSPQDARNWLTKNPRDPRPQP